jgi:hypothetical protein
MPEPTLEPLAARIAELERKLAEKEPPEKDWRSIVGMYRGSEFAKAMLEECQKLREEDREATLREYGE